MRGMSSDGGLDVEKHSRFLQPEPEMMPMLNAETHFLLLGDSVWDIN